MSVMISGHPCRNEQLSAEVVPHLAVFACMVVERMEWAGVASSFFFHTELRLPLLLGSSAQPSARFVGLAVDEKQARYFGDQGITV